MASSTPKRNAGRLTRTIVLIGLMGAGKTSVGRKLAQKLDTPFYDSDHEIEEAAGLSVSDIFAVHGEVAFRDAERKVIQRLLTDGISIVATGGGAFMDERTRQAIAENAVSVWLRASIAVLAERTSHGKRRPLLLGKDPVAVLTDLAARRNDSYAMANLIIDTDGMTAEGIATSLLVTLTAQGVITP